MPNANTPRGLVPVRQYNGNDVRLEAYAIAPGLAVTISEGDPVKSTGTSKQITLCAFSDNAVGVFKGCNYTRPDGEYVFSKNWISGTQVKTGTTVMALVIDDPDVLFEIQATTGAAVDIGGVADYIVGTGNLSTGSSTFQLDGASVAATGTKALKIVDYVPRDDVDTNNGAAITFVKWLVLINKHELNAARSAV